MSDQNGQFRFYKLSVGRYVLKISYVGYKSAVIPEILLESGNENIQNIRLNADATIQTEATVRAAKSDGYNSVQEITTEQTLRFAATYLDSARIATSFASVASANDQANGLVIRGKSPK